MSQKELSEVAETEEIENVRVFVRVRPLSKKESDAGHVDIATVDLLNGIITVKNPAGSAHEPPKTFTFDTVFDANSKQLDIYNETARPIVDKVLSGFNGTIFAYGQTGTGKTFTMEGVNNVPELKGIIPNSFAHIFGHIAKADESVKFLVRVSYFEIYNEEIRDLLSKNKDQCLEVKERPDIGVYVKDLSAYIANNADDMEKIMSLGNKNRSVGATAMNEVSSRSHAIFSIIIETSSYSFENAKTQHVKMGRLHLVDLAGSERQAKTGASGQRLKEASKINLSLSTLGNVISALVDGKCTHIPYRNSKLTRILQDSLGGNSKTVMCATVGPASYNYEETISTLRYASRVKKICNKARVNQDPKDALLIKYQKEISELKKKLEEASVPPPREEPTPNPEPELDETEPCVEPSEVIEDETDAELKRAQSDHQSMVEKLELLQKKVLVGGENLLEKAEIQQQLLDAAAQELEHRKQKEEELKKNIQEKDAERIDMEEKYSSLQEESEGLSKKLKKVSSMLLAAKEERKDVQRENRKEIEGFLDNVRQITKEYSYQQAIIQKFIPTKYLELMTQNATWNEDIGEWELKCVAYTGNNMRKIVPQPEDTTATQIAQPDFSHLYRYYPSEKVKNSGSGQGGGRSKSAFRSDKMQP